MTIFEKNCECLKKIQAFSSIFDGTLSMSNSTCASVYEAVNGEPVIAYERNGETYFLNSKYNPSYEARKFVERALNLPETAILVMFGLSNALYAREFVEGNKNNNIVIIYEPCIDIFYEVINNIDISDILSTGRVILRVKGINDDSFGMKFMGLLSDSNIKTNLFLELPMYMKLFEKEYDEYHSIITDRFTVYQIATNTLQVMGKRIVYTTLNNMRFIPNCRSMLDYIGAFPEDLPAVVVAAGPSLEKNVELLKVIKNKALVVVVDAAIRTVLSRGITPDFVISVDNNKELKHFEVEGIENVRFLADASSSTDVLEKVGSKELYFYSTDTPVWAKMFKEQGSKLECVYSGGSVALDALTLVMGLGFKKVILIGQDLALTDNKRYAGGGKITNDEIEKVQTLYVKDIYGEDVLTRKDYFTFIKNIEDIAQTHSDIDIIDATEGGALKKHTIIMTFKEAIDKYCTREVDIDQILDSIPKRFENGGELIVKREYQNMKSRLKKLGDEMSSMSIACKKAKLMLERHDYNKKELKTINVKMGKLDEKYLNSDEHELIRKYIAVDEFSFVSDVYIEEDDRIKDAINLYEKSQNYYKAISNATKDIIKIVDACLTKLDEKWQ